ncbi:hypothetical protein PV08_07453 [Exophiala spinifera]|uniref:Large ribosomal subunit protein bL33m n=1 Tax=Exophiala spinifera TaxID=91928 RepID=A0A0D2BTT8_9EURO|nr:uncharacterized protein PV08_07453 [Exophiala spinifera]KIW14669.1 hypothetical protein PV08_07453 [Exophiala spinifera]
MAMTGFYRTMIRPRTSRPLSMLKYDPVVKRQVLFLEQKRVILKMLIVAATLHIGREDAYCLVTAMIQVGLSQVGTAICTLTVAKVEGRFRWYV